MTTGFQDEAYHDKFRLIKANTKWSFTSTENQVLMLSCIVHGVREGLKVKRYSLGYSETVCSECYISYFPEIKPAVRVVSIPIKPAVEDATYICSVGNCHHTVSYHDTCTFCHRYACNEHCDSSYCCFVCLNDREGMSENNIRKSERGS